VNNPTASESGKSYMHRRCNREGTILTPSLTPQKLFILPEEKQTPGNINEM
jgi:hypothetical protein